MIFQLATVTPEIDKIFINKDVKKILSNLKKNKSYYQKYGKFLAEKNFYVGVSKNFINIKKKVLFLKE